MYKCALTILIISPDRQLEQLLAPLPAPERFSFSLETHPTLESEFLPRADVLIFTELPEKGLDMVRRDGKSDATLVLCSSLELFLALPAETLAHLDDFWPAPTSPETISFFFQKMMEKRKLAKDLWLVNNYLDTGIDSIPDLVWFKDLHGVHLKVNNSFCNTVGKTKEQCEGRGHYYIWDLELEEYEKGEYVCLETEDEVIRRRETCLSDEIVKGKQGLRQFLTYKSPIFDTDHTLIGTVGIAHDVTDFKNVHKELDLLLQNIPYAILLADKDGFIHYVNTKFCESFHTSLDELSGRSYTTWKSQALNPTVGQEIIKESEADGSEVMQLDGQEVFFSVQETPAMDIFQNLLGICCTFRDITLEHRLHKEILRNANTDFLTGLYNRRYLYKFIESQGKNAQINLLSIDLDNFKYINDTYGHQFGDYTIITAAKLIERSFADGCVARIGGDEFLVVLVGPYLPEHLTQLAGKLLHGFCQEFSLRTEWSTVSASIGIAYASRASLSLEELILQADLALYKAKKMGKSTWQMYDSEKNTMD